MVSMVGILIHKVVPEGSRDNWALVDFLISTFGFQAVSLAAVHVFLRWHGMSWGDFLGLSQARPTRMVLVGMVSAVALIGPILGVKWASEAGLHLLQNTLAGMGVEWLELTPEDQAPVQVLRNVQRWQDYLWFGVSAVVFAPLVEEILFRGILYGHLRRCGHRKLGLWLSSLLFAAIHVNLVTLLPLTLMAVCLVWLYEASDSLAVPILCHSTFNLMNFCLLIWGPQSLS